MAMAYGLDAGDLAHVLETFPLVAARERTAAVDAFRRERDAI